MSSDERLHALGRIRLVCNHHHPISVHVHGAQAALSVTHQAEHGFVKVLVLLLCTQTQTCSMLTLKITSFHLIHNNLSILIQTSNHSDKPNRISSRLQLSAALKLIGSVSCLTQLL